MRTGSAKRTRHKVISTRSSPWPVRKQIRWRGALTPRNCRLARHGARTQRRAKSLGSAACTWTSRAPILRMMEEPSFVKRSAARNNPPAPGKSRTGVPQESGFKTREGGRGGGGASTSLAPLPNSLPAGQVITLRCLQAGPSRGCWSNGGRLFCINDAPITHEAPTSVERRSSARA